jgi:CyaY protein
MNEQQYHTEVDKLFYAIEQALEKSALDIDFESQQGILTLELPNKGEIILSRQTALQEVWLASPLGAFHFQYQHHKWLTKQGQSLVTTLTEIVQKLMAVTVDFSDK